MNLWRHRLSYDIWKISETNISGGTSFQEIRESSRSQEKADDDFERVILSTSQPVCKSLATGEEAGSEEAPERDLR